MENGTIAVAAAVVINVVAVAWNIRETFVLHRQTKELQVSNAKLQIEINRLSVHLDQAIVRLNRINELTRAMCLRSAELSYSYFFRTENTNEKSDNSKTNGYTHDEIVAFVTTFHSARIEMEAIARVIKDTDLQMQVSELRSIVPFSDASASRMDILNSQKKLENHATALFESVYRLLEQATDSRDVDRHKEASK